MEDFDQEWMAEFKRQVEQDIFYHQLDREMAVVRNGCRIVLEELPPDRRRMLEHYLYLTKQMEIAMTRVAYTQGKLHGQKHRIP